MRKKIPGRVTVMDIAREAGVSTQTVSRVVNNSSRVADSTRKKVQEIIRRSNYRPNRAARILANQQSLTIGLIIPNVANPYYPEIVHGIEAVAAEHGYSVLLYNTERKPEREQKALDLLEEYRVAGVVVCAAVLPDQMLIPLLERQQAVMVINRILPDNVAGRVMIDFKQGVREAVRHLFETGKKNIAYLSYEPSIYYSNPSRKAGFLQALEDLGWDMASEFIVPCNLSVDSGYETTLSLLREHPNIDGIICYNDIVAIGALRACVESKKRVPEDVGIIGCDNILMARYVTPPLTSISISQYELGATTGRMLLQRIKKDKNLSETIFTPTLVIRESTKR